MMDLRPAVGPIRRAIISRMTDSLGTLDRAAKQIEGHEKRRAFDALQAETEVHRAEFASYRPILMDKLSASRADARAWADDVLSPSLRVSEAREILVRDLNNRKREIFASREDAEKQLSDAKAAGQELGSRRISHGPSPTQTRNRGVASATMGVRGETIREGQRVPVSPEFQSPAPNSAQQRDIERRLERLGHSEDLPPAPSSPSGPAEREQPASTSESVGSHSQRELLREQALLRQDEARRKLRKIALDRIRRLNIAIVADAAGCFAVVQGGLADDEMRALMDPALRRETQAALGAIATAQAQRGNQQAANLSQQDSLPRQGSPEAVKTVSAEDDDYEWLQLQRAHRQGRGGMGDT